jgi:F-type H+-transporting ATPase subunit b
VVLILVTPAQAQDAGHGAAPADAHAPADTHAATEAHGGEHGGFPPFEPSTYGSQILWLAIAFGLLYWLAAKVALPRIGGIIEARDRRIGADLAAAEALKAETDAAVAAYEQALAEARARAHGIAHQASEQAKAALDAKRREIESALADRVAASEARIGEVKARALAEVDVIARDAAGALVEVLTGAAASDAEVAAAVAAAKSEGTL